MANTTIDRVSIEVEATAKGTSAVFSQIISQANTLKSVLSGLDVSKLSQVSKASNALKIDTSGMTKAEKEVSDKINAIKVKMAELQELKNSALSGNSSSMTSFERKTISIQSQIDGLTERLRQLSDTRTGVSIDTDTFQTYRDELSQVQGDLTATRDQVASTVATMNSSQPTIDTGETSSHLSDIADKAQTAASSLLKMTASGIKSGFSNLKSNLSKIKDTLSNIGTKSSNAVSTGFSKILKYGFGIRSLYVLFRRLRTAVKDSFTELQNSGAYYETTKANVEALKNSLSTLKYQFGAAFEPIFNTVAPALETLINYLVSVMNTISAFIAKLTGKSTYSKAVVATAEIASNTGSAASSASELNKQLQGFDELNNLSPDSGSSGGGSSGSSSDSSSVNYVEESVDSALTSFWDSLADAISSGDWKSVGSMISEKLTEAMNSIDWDSIYEKASNFGTGLANFLNGLITTDLFSALGSTLAGAINTAFTFLDSFGTTFDWTNFGTSIGTGITTFFEDADFALYGDTVHTWVGGILDAGIALLDSTDFDLIGEKLADFLNGLQIGDLASKLYTFAKKLVQAIAEAITSLWNNSDLQTKIGLAIVGMLVAGKLTGLSAKLGTAITSYLVANPIVLGKIAIAITEFELVFDVAKNGFGDWADYFGDDELAEYYKTFSWSEFWDTITNGGEGIDMDEISDAWGDMCYDYFNPLFEAIDTWIDDLKEKINSIDLVQSFKTMYSNIKKAWNNAQTGNGDNGQPHGYNGAPSDVSSMLDYQNRVSYWNEQGGYIVDGIAEGIRLSLLANPFTAPVVLLYEKIRDTIKDKFGIESPAKAMYDIGEYIFKGIIEGFKEAMNSYSWTDLTNDLYDFFTGTERKGLTAQGDFSSKSASDKTHSKTGKSGNGGGSSIKFDVTYNTKVTGAATSRQGLSDLKESFANLNTEASKSTDATYSAKTGGQLSDINTLDTWRQKIRNLISSWTSQSATYRANVGGQMTSIDDTETWIEKIQKLDQEWQNSASSTSFNVTSDVSNLDGAGGYLERLNKAKEEWKKNNPTATFTTNLAGSVTSTSGIDTLAGSFKTLKENYPSGAHSSSWSTSISGKSASEISTYASAVKSLYDKFYTGSHTASYTVSLSGNYSGVDALVETIMSKINKKMGNYKIKVDKITASGGAFFGGSWHNIPQYAGGTLDAGSIFVAGEAGAELVGNINGRSEVLNRSQLASVMNVSFEHAMGQFGHRLLSASGIQYNTPSFNAYRASSEDNAYMMSQQNELLREQNQLLREIASKDVSISSRDVFKATQSEANNYYNRTGNSPFLY